MHERTNITVTFSDKISTQLISTVNERNDVGLLIQKKQANWELQGERETSAILLKVVGDDWKDQKYIHNRGLNLIVFSEKGVSCSVLFTSYCFYR